MSKSMLYTVNSATQTLADGSVINLGTIIRRFGCNCNLSGNAIKIQGPGYYKLIADVTIAPTAADTTITITAYKDGIVIPGASAKVAVTTAANPISIPIAAVLKENCACCDDASNITFIVSGGASSVTNIVTITEKL